MVTSALAIKENFTIKSQNKPGSPMDPIWGFHGMLRPLAVTLDGKTAQLQWALDREESNFEDCPMRILYDLRSELRTLKDDVNILDKAKLGKSRKHGFHKGNKNTDEKEFNGYHENKRGFPEVWIYSTCQEKLSGWASIDSKPASSEHECPEKPDVKDDFLDSAAPKLLFLRSHRIVHSFLILDLSDTSYPKFCQTLPKQ